MKYGSKLSTFLLLIHLLTTATLNGFYAAEISNFPCAGAKVGIQMATKLRRLDAITKVLWQWGLLLLFIPYLLVVKGVQT